MAVKLGNVKDFPAGDMNIAKAGDREILVVNTGTGIYGLDPVCVHGGCKLLHGKLSGERLRCLCHGSVFDVRTGTVISGPATRPQPSFPLAVRDGEVFLGD